MPILFRLQDLVSNPTHNASGHWWAGALLPVLTRPSRTELLRLANHECAPGGSRSQAVIPLLGILSVRNLTCDWLIDCIEWLLLIDDCNKRRSLSRSQQERFSSNYIYIYLFPLFFPQVLNSIGYWISNIWSFRHFFRGNLLLPHRLLFPTSSKGSFIYIFPQTREHIPQPVVDYRFEQKIVQTANGSTKHDQ